jgi:ferredoxin
MARDDAVTIAIDRIACDGRGVCAELLPELIELDDWGYPIVAPGSVPPHLVEHAKRAVTYCPVLAFKLRATSRAESHATAPVRQPSAARQPG